MNPIFLFLLCITLAFPDTGKAISLRTNNYAVLEMKAGNSPLDSFDFWDANTVQAQVRVVRKWPSNSHPVVTASLRLGFTCNLWKNIIAKTNVIAGPCGMPYQFEAINEPTPISSSEEWTFVSGAPIAPKIERFLNFMYPTNAQIAFTVSGADSVEIQITDWKTDNQSISSPTQTDHIDRLQIWNDAGRDLKIVETSIPSSIRTSSRKTVSLTNHNKLHWKGNQIDCSGRRITP